VFLLSDEWVGLQDNYTSSIGRVISPERVRMEYVPVLALMLGVIKVAIMWLNYAECKRQKNTDCDHEK
jgi:hypothetical protein